MTLSNRCRRNADLVGQRQRLGIERGIAERDEIVEQLHAVAVAGPADVDDAAGPCLEHRLNPLKHRVGGADHGVERALPGLLRGAAERRVGEVDAERRAPRRAPPSRSDRRSSNRPPRAGLQSRPSGRPVRARCPRPGRTGDAEKDDRRRLRNRRRRVRLAPRREPHVLGLGTILRPRKVSGYPFSTMFLAIPWPINPRPMKPIWSSGGGCAHGLSSCLRRLPAPGRSLAAAARNHGEQNGQADHVHRRQRQGRHATSSSIWSTAAIRC